MNNIKVMLDNLESTVLTIGRVGENLHTQVQINCVGVFNDYPNASASLTVQPPVGDVYPAVIERSGIMLLWDVVAGDLNNSGGGKIQITFTNGDEVIKTVIGNTNILPSLTATGEAPDPIQNWLDEANEALAEFGEIDNISASAETLTPGSAATAEITTIEGHKNIKIGVPKGEKGEKGEQGDPAPESSVTDAVDAYLAENFSNPDSPPLDRTLSSSLAAAPADMVGDLKSALYADPSIEHFYDNWELGTANVSSGSISYFSSTTVMRIKQNTTVSLKAGDILFLDGVTSRIMKKTNNTWSVLSNAQTGQYTIAETGDYAFTLYYTVSSAITSQYDLITRFNVIKVDGLLATQLKTVENKIEPLYSEEYYKIITGLFESGTAFVSGTTINYSESNAVIRIKQGTTISLKTGDVLEADSYAKYRLIKAGSTPTTVIDNTNPEKYTITADGDYVIAIKYADGSTVSDINALLSHFGIIQKSSQLKRKIDGIESQLGNNDEPLIMNEHHNYVFNKDNFEIGTVSASTTLAYYSSTSVIRPIQHTFIELNAGDIVVPKDGAKYRTILVTDATTSPETAHIVHTYGDYIDIPLKIETTGKYAFAIAYADGATVTDIADLLGKFEIIKHNADLLTLSNPKEDNSAKGVFSVMSYNVGQWWNGSSVRASDSKFETLYNMQKSILDLYDADIICLQEYTDALTDTRSALGYLIDPMYLNVGKAIPHDTITAGKLIGTNKKMAGATNIEFTNDDGAYRNYEKAYIWLNGRKVCVISAHLSLSSATNALECTELINAVADEDYFIICMDSNVDNADTTSSVYQASIKQFTDAGYKLANSEGLITYEADELALDQIVVSANINVKSCVVDKQKYGFADGSDHYPLIAYLEVY